MLYIVSHQYICIAQGLGCDTHIGSNNHRKIFSVTVIPNIGKTTSALGRMQVIRINQQFKLPL